MIEANSQIEAMKTECLETKQKLEEETKEKETLQGTLKNKEEHNKELTSQLEEMSRKNL